MKARSPRRHRALPPGRSPPSSRSPPRQGNPGVPRRRATGPRAARPIASLRPVRLVPPPSPSVPAPRRRARRRRSSRLATAGGQPQPRATGTIAPRPIRTTPCRRRLARRGRLRLRPDRKGTPPRRPTKRRARDPIRPRFTCSQGVDGDPPQTARFSWYYKLNCQFRTLSVQGLLAYDSSRLADVQGEANDNRGVSSGSVDLPFPDLLTPVSLATG